MRRRSDPGRDYRGESGSVTEPDVELDEKSLQKKAEITAIRLLARREHGVEELRRKLTTKGYPDSVVDFVVAKLSGKKLVSDDRFTSSFVHHHAQRGQGPVRIRAELRQQGVAGEAIESALETAEVDWPSRASAVRRRKFGDCLPRTAPERAKQARFLQYRGFSSDQIRAAFKSDAALADMDAGLDPDPD